MYKEEFTPSQFMSERYFEFHHTYNETPPEVEFHQHPFYEIFFFLSGNVNYIIEGKNYNLRPGDVLLTGSSDIHRPDIRPGKPYERIVTDTQNILHLKQLCAQISKAKHNHDFGSYALVSAYLTEFLVLISRAYYDAPDSIKYDITENKKINQILLYINENRTSQSIFSKLYLAL